MMSSKVFASILVIVIAVVMIALVRRLIAASRQSGKLRYVSHLQMRSGYAITVLTPSNDLALFRGAFSEWARCPCGPVVTADHAAQLAEFHVRLLWAAPLLDTAESVNPAALRSGTLKADLTAVAKGVS